MQSISTPSFHVVPAPVSEAVETDHGVLHLEKLLNKIFGDELDKALAGDADYSQSQSHNQSNLIEFPLIQELVSLEPETVNLAETLDFSPEAFAIGDPVLETDLTRFTPSIIEGDDFDGSHYQAVIDAQAEQLSTLRAELKQRDLLIQAQTLEMASKDDQLKYMPDLFSKALELSNVQAANEALSVDLKVEQMVNEEINCELIAAMQELDVFHNHPVVKFARFLGLMS
ncbi:MAG: hypothetical protein JST01_16665 [Cyanobacteria bacterium SZAS TMP-1]|nr:hypothetical protein [Cyanobacteria bacterium SZAS TMP-1]